jgi:hypothetical protein
MTDITHSFIHVILDTQETIERASFFLDQLYVRGDSRLRLQLGAVASVGWSLRQLWSISKGATVRIDTRKINMLQHLACTNTSQHVTTLETMGRTQTHDQEQ